MENIKYILFYFINHDMEFRKIQDFRYDVLNIYYNIVYTFYFDFYFNEKKNIEKTS